MEIGVVQVKMLLFSVALIVWASDLVDFVTMSSISSFSLVLAIAGHAIVVWVVIVGQNVGVFDFFRDTFMLWMS